MISKKILNNVLRNVIAGKEDIPPNTAAVPGAPPSAGTLEPTAPDSISPAPQQQLNHPVTRKRFYFFAAPPDNSINFQGITATLNGQNQEEKKKLINNLKGGYGVESSAAYFKWEKLIVSTTQYSKDGKKPVILDVNLNDDGTQDGAGDVYPKDSGVTPDMFIKDLGIFSGKGGKMVAIDTSGESTFYNYYKGVPNNVANSVVNAGTPPPPPDSIPVMNAASFNGLFDQYRMFKAADNRILMPNGELSTKDGVPGGNYPGGTDAFNKVVGPVLQKMQAVEQKKGQGEGPSLEEEVKKGPGSEKSVFEPVDEQPKDRVKGDVIDKPTGSPMKPRFSSDDIRIRSLARRVLAGYFGEETEAASEDDPEVKEALTTGQTVRGIGQYETDSETYKGKAERSRQEAKLYDNMAQQLQKFDKLGK